MPAPENWSFRGRLGDSAFLFCGPQKIKAIVCRNGMLQPEAYYGLRALGDPAFLRRLQRSKRVWEVHVHKEDRSLVKISSSGYKLELRLLGGQVSRQLEWALKDIFERHVPAGTEFARRAAILEKHQLRESGEAHSARTKKGMQEAKKRRRSKAAREKALAYWARKREQTPETAKET